MTTTSTTTDLHCGIRFRRLAGTALLGVLAFGTAAYPGASGAEGVTDPYDVLYDVIMTRYGKDGKTYGEDETSPVLFTDSQFPFGDKTYAQFTAALDAMIALPKEKIEAYSDIQRALLQLHLWKLFDAACPYRWEEPGTGKPRVANKNHQPRRNAAQPKIALLIQRLALTESEIKALPDTRTATVKSERFATQHDPRDEFEPFLPADLYAKESSWVCIGTDETVPVDLHVDRVDWRAAFYSFIRLPGGYAESARYIENATSKENIPIGTQVALVKQAFLISDQGKLVLSPLVVSISVRAYVDVEQSVRSARPAVAQCFAELVMQPRQLMEGNAVMRAIRPLEHRFEVSEKFICQDTRDPFETGRVPRLARLNSCVNCHNAKGHQSVLTSNGAGLGPLYAADPIAISGATLKEKQKHHTWKSLQELWQTSSNDGSDSIARR